MSYEQSLRELHSNEIEFVQMAYERGTKICNHYLDDLVAIRPETCDQVYERWFSDDNEQKPSSNDICHGLGALIGELIVSELSFQWRIVADQYGEDYCVHHPDKWQSFPFDFVSKRIQDQEAKGGFFRALFELLRDRRSNE